jgi:hypothetical protein
MFFLPYLNLNMRGTENGEEAESRETRADRYG